MTSTARIDDPQETAAAAGSMLPLRAARHPGGADGA
jgi:hypothetical protein